MLRFGAGTAMVYPTLLAAVSDATESKERARTVGVYRFWRDTGFVVGALLAGIAADVSSAETAILVVAGLTATSGLIVTYPLELKAPAPPSRRSPRSGRTVLADNDSVVRATKSSHPRAKARTRSTATVCWRPRTITGRFKIQRATRLALAQAGAEIERNLVRDEHHIGLAAGRRSTHRCSHGDVTWAGSYVGHGVGTGSRPRS